MDDMHDDGYGDLMTYDSDDRRHDAELVSTRLHGMKLTEDGGDEDDTDTADVFSQRHGFSLRKTQ